jgi:hypothetical protein
MFANDEPLAEITIAAAMNVLNKPGLDQMRLRLNPLLSSSSVPVRVIRG